MTSRLIVTADDVGLHRGMTLGTIEAHRNGIVTACSIVANGREFRHAADLLRDLPALDVGVHLTVVEEKPLLPPERVTSLTDSSGNFVKNFKLFFMRYVLGRVRFPEVEAEFRAQIEAVLAMGLSLVHVNGHQHLHVLPRIFEIVLRLAEEYRVGYVRVPRDDVPAGTRMLRLTSIRALNRFGKLAARRAEGQVAFPERTIGITDAGHLDVGKLTALVTRFDGVTELVCHPGIGNAELSRAYPAWNYRWDEERVALCDPAVRELLAARGVETVRIQDLPAR